MGGERLVNPAPIAAHAAIQQVQRSLDRGRGLCLLAGAGLTIAATGDSANSWQELIKRGAAACENHGRDHAWVDRVAADVGTGEVGDMLAAAEKVTYGLGGPDDKRFYTWLRETVGSVEPKNLELLDEVKRLAGHDRVTVLTTNYDSLLSDHLRLPPVTWRAALPVLEDAYLDHEQRAVIHLHGHWLEPRSVVFGATSYARLGARRSSLEFLKKALLSNTMVTIGVGAGMADPTFELLLDWADVAVKNLHKIFYLHVTGATVPKRPSVTPVPLSSHDELVDFFGQIRDTPGIAVTGTAKPGGVDPFPADTLRMVRKLAASASQTPEASRARLFLGIYRNEVDRVLDTSAATDRLAPAWADLLTATWQALNEP